MLKKSKVVALLVVCVMMFAVVEPACARSWEQVGEDTAYGSVMGGSMGAIVGAFLVGAAVVATGGWAALIPAAAAIGGSAVTGAGYGAAGGAILGALGGKEAVEQYVQDVGQNAAGQVAGNITEQRMRNSGSTEQQITDYRNSVKNTPLEYESWHNNH